MRREKRAVQVLRRDTYPCLGCGQDVVVPEYLDRPIWRRCPHGCGTWNYYDPEKKEATQMATEKPPQDQGHSEPVEGKPDYGPPWRKYAMEVVEDVVRLGREAAKKLWKARGMPPKAFGQLAKKLKRASLPTSRDRDGLITPGQGGTNHD